MTDSSTKATDQHEWIRWLRGAARVRSLPHPRSANGRLLAAGAERLLVGSALPEPVLITLAERHLPSLSAARCEALAALSTHGTLDGEKLNAPVGRSGAALAEEIDIPGLVRHACGLDVLPPATATYVGYLEPGRELELHLDLHGFGDLVFLLCLVHDPVALGGSETVFVTSRAQRRFGLKPREALLFDGVRTPHGRTPVSASERVVLLALGLTIADANPMPFPPPQSRHT